MKEGGSDLPHNGRFFNQSKKPGLRAMLGERTFD